MLYIDKGQKNMGKKYSYNGCFLLTSTPHKLFKLKHTVNVNFESKWL